jgi:hypothetical protein
MQILRGVSICNRSGVQGSSQTLQLLDTAHNIDQDPEYPTYHNDSSPSISF